MCEHSPALRVLDTMREEKINWIRFGQILTNQDIPFKRKTVHKGRHGIEKMKGKMPSKTPRFRLAVAPFFNHNGVKKGLLPHY